MAIPANWDLQSKVKGSENAPPSVYSAIIPGQRYNSSIGYQSTTQKVRLVTNAKTGSMQMYGIEGISGAFGADQLIGTYSATTGKWSPTADGSGKPNIIWSQLYGDRSRITRTVNGVTVTSDGTEQLRRITASGKARTIEIAETLAADPNNTAGITPESVEALKNKSGMTSTNNTAVTDPVQQSTLREQREEEEKAAEAAATTETTTETTTDEEKPPQNIEDLKIEPEERTNYEGTASTPLKYPEDLAETQQDYFQIRMVKFVPRKVQGGITPSRANTPTENQKVLSTIFLPITGGINDSNTVDWSKGDMDLAAGALAGFTFGAISQGVEGATNAANNTVNDIEANIGGVKNAVANKITESLTGVNTLQRNFGAVLNQNTELLFNGPTLRQHSFTYKFSPRSNTEAEIVKKIIRTLKQGMSAKKANGFLFVKSPHTFFLSYHFKNQDHPYLNKFKQCALTSLAVNYTPDGNYATYHDGSMISYQVTMSFQELEPVFDSDYGDGYANIGY